MARTLSQEDIEDGLPFDLRPSETAELLADPQFKAHLARMKAGKVRYHDAKSVAG